MPETKMPHDSRQETRTEHQIMRTWSTSCEPVVSVICTTYNQAHLIEDALRGFLAQVTSFPFEIVVHDDASTDETAAILKSYAARYPRIIRTILQTANQFSQGRKPASIAIGEARGRYLALCEGDDYWTNITKLRRQVDILENHLNLDLCWHDCLVQNTRTGRLSNRSATKPRSDHVSPAQIIENDGGFIPTLSLMMRREAVSQMPCWFESHAPIGDFFFQIYAARRGGGHYISEPMGVYRINQGGSWTGRVWGNVGDRLRFETAFHRCLLYAEPDFPGLSRSFSKLIFRHFSLLGLFAIRHRSRDAFEFARESILARRGDLGLLDEMIVTSIFATPWTLLLK